MTRTVSKAVRITLKALGQDMIVEVGVPVATGTGICTGLRIAARNDGVIVGVESAINNDVEVADMTSTRAPGTVGCEKHEQDETMVISLSAWIHLVWSHSTRKVVASVNFNTTQTPHLCFVHLAQEVHYALSIHLI